jgi:hypothetical protein
MNFKHLSLALCAVIAISSIAVTTQNFAMEATQSASGTTSNGQPVNVTINFAADKGSKKEKKEGLAQFFNYKNPQTYAILVAFGAFAHMICKEDPAAKPMGLKEGVKGLFTQNPFTQKYLTHVGTFIDDVVIGYAGKKRGIRALGSKLLIEGEPQSIDAHAQKIMNNNENVAFYKYNNAAPYGMLGTVWAYAAGIGKGFKELRETAQTAQWVGSQIA